MQVCLVVFLNNKNKVNKPNSPIKKQQKLATKAIIVKQIKIICQKDNMRDLFYESGVWININEDTLSHPICPSSIELHLILAGVALHS